MTSGHPTALLRADASQDIGIGHVTRSVALAGELARRGWRIIVASRSLPAATTSELRERGFERLLLDADGENEPAVIERLLCGRRVTATIVDHYQLGVTWHRAARRWSEHVVVIDDLGSHQLDADLVVNQNLGESEGLYAGLVPSHCRLLMGPRFALLRPEFAEARGSGARVRASLRRLLVFLSGADPLDVTGRVARVANQVGLPMDVVVGPAYPHVASLRRWGKQSPRATVYVGTRNMAELMIRADLSIGAPSSASWERCCLGLPSLLLVVAENQVRTGAALQAAGAAITLGWHETVSDDALFHQLASLASGSRLAEMSMAAASITDGLGATRVAEAIEQVSRGKSNA